MEVYFLDHISNEFHLKKVWYKNDKKFVATHFLRYLDHEMVSGKTYKNNNDMYSTFSEVFKSY